MPSPTKKNAAFTIILPILDADGDLVPAGASLTSVIAGADGVALLPAFGAGPVPVDEGEGFYSIELTAAQMNFDRIAGVLKTTTAGAKNTPFTIYTSVRQIDDLATPTNITAATGIVLSGVTHTGAVIPTVSAVTGLTAATVHSDLDDIQARLPAALTAGGNIKADALAWNGLATVALPATPTNITAATGVVLSGVTHTGAVIPTVSTLTGHTAQTGDNFARIGATGSGLTSLATQASVNAVDDFVDTEIADIQARLPAALVGGRMDSSTGAMAAAVITAASIAADAITDAKVAADVTIASVTGAVGSVAGAVGSVTAGVTVTTNNDKAGYALTSADHVVGADTLLDRNMATGADSGSPTVRTVRQALRFLRNKWSITAGTLTVTKEDDVTASFTATVTTDAAAVPIIGNDPA